MIADILGVFLIAVAVVVGTELLSYRWVYRKEDYVRLCQQVDRMTKMVEQKKQEPLTTNRDLKNNKKLGRVEQQLQQLTAQLSSFNLRIAFINIVFALGGYQVLNAFYEGRVVVKLPFVPWKWFANITHRGLEGDDLTEASAHLFFALGLLIVRSNVAKFMEARGLKPRPPKQLSLWDLANAEAEKLEQKMKLCEERRVLPV